MTSLTCPPKAFSTQQGRGSYQLLLRLLQISALHFRTVHRLSQAPWPTLTVHTAKHECEALALLAHMKDHGTGLMHTCGMSVLYGLISTAVK